MLHARKQREKTIERDERRTEKKKKACLGNLKEGKSVHILFTEEIEYGSVPEEMLKNTNGIAYESSADSYLQGKSSYNSMC